MSCEIFLIYFALICLVAASAASWIQLVSPGERVAKYILPVSICGFIPVIIALILRSFEQERMPAFGRFEAISFYMAAVFFSYILLFLKYRLTGISALVLPFTTILLLLAATGLHEDITVSTRWPTGWLSLHILTAFAGYGLFTTSAMLAVCYIIQDYNLKHKKLETAAANWPSLETLDNVMRRQIGSGFTMFTMSIIFGIIMVRQTTNAAEWLGDVKVAATGATWLVYAVLLHLRTTADRHGKKIAFATIAGLLFVLFAFCGVHMIAESTHNFVMPPGI